MRMFWRHRLDAMDEASAWQVPYADLMSLLMAVFVLIATMSELRSGKRFDAVSGGLRSALGFAAKPVGPDTAALARRELTLSERLEQTRRVLAARETNVKQEETCDYQVVTESDVVLVRIQAADAFDRGQSFLKMPAGRAIRTVAEALAGGQARVEIRGYSVTSDGESQGGAPDLLDLSYRRARAVAEVLNQSGVPSRRLQLAALGEGRPLKKSGSGTPVGPDAGVEIVIHAVPTAPQNLLSPRKSS